jgi:hypothetical protein
MNSESELNQLAGTPPDLNVTHPEGGKKESAERNLRAYRDEIAAFLQEPYDYTVYEDPFFTGGSVKGIHSMARFNNSFPIVQKIEILIHPRSKLVSGETAHKLKQIAEDITELNQTQLSKDLKASGGAILYSQEEGRQFAAKIEEMLPGDYLGRTFRSQEEVNQLKALITKAVGILDEEINKSV